MKKAVFLFLFVLFCQTSFAQKCKFDYDKADPFTGKRTFSIKPDLARGWGMAIISTAGNYDISISVIVGGLTKNVINKGDTLLMALEGDLPLILKANAEYLPVSNAAGSTVYTSYTASYSITKADLLRLSQKSMRALRMYVGVNAFNVEVKEKNAEKIAKAAACMAAEQ
ncbi:MAG: hypothetical protein JNL60_09415 [Bacteroidia bacterium]|nr:hypothetical protein [Bacteroidia bacterium]